MPGPQRARATIRLVENRSRLRQIIRVTLKNNFNCLLIAAVFISGCGKSISPAPAAPPAGAASTDDDLPRHAQAKLPTLKMYLGAETLDAELALTQEQEMTGMMYRTNILDTDAMIFVLPYTTRANFWMKNCPESISAAYISPDGVILEIHHLEKNDTNPVVAATENIRFVLETSDGWFTRHHIEPGTVIRTEKGALRETFLK